MTLEFEPVHDIAAEIEHFARCLLTGARPIQTHVEGIDVLGVILAAYESVATSARRAGAALGNVLAPTA